MKDYLINKRLNELCKNGHLTNDQNLLLLEEYAQDKQNGVAPEDSEARTLLILGNTKLIFHIIKRGFEVNVTNDSEEFSVGQISLIRAIDTFNIDSNVKFTTYASSVIYNEIAKYCKYLKVRHLLPDQQNFLEDYVNDDSDYNKKLQVVDIICDDEDFVQQVHDKCMFEAIVKNIKYLTYIEAFSVINIYGLLGNAQKGNGEIAKALNVSHSYVTRSVNLGLRKLKILISQDKDLIPEEKKLKHKMLQRGPINNIVGEHKAQSNIL